MDLSQSPRQYATTWFAPRVCKRFWVMGKKSFRSMLREAMCSSVLPPHKATGKINYNAIENEPKKLSLW